MILIGIAQAIYAGDPVRDARAPVPGQQKLDDLIRQLGDPRYPVREAAAKELTERIDAVPLLEKALKSSDAEIARQAGRVLEANKGRRQRRALQRALNWGKAGRIDLMIDALAIWDGPKDSEEYWQSVIDIARLLAKPADDRYVKAHNISALEKDALLLRSVITDFRSRGLPAVPYFSKAIIDEASRTEWLGYARCETARIRCPANASAVVASDSVVIDGTCRSSIVLSNGDVECSESFCSIIICGGTIRPSDGSPLFRLTGSLVIARRWQPHGKYNDFSGSVLLCAEPYERPSKKVRFSTERSVIEDGKPLDFIKWFDPIEVGVRVAERDKQVVIDRAEPVKPFARAGLKAGDVIVAVDGKEPGTAEGFRRLVRKGVVREKVVVTFRRAGKLQEVTVRLPEVPEYLPPPRVRPADGP